MNRDDLSCCTISIDNAAMAYQILFMITVVLELPVETP